MVQWDSIRKQSTGSLVRIPVAPIFLNFFSLYFSKFFFWRKKFCIQIDEICRENAKKNVKKMNFQLFWGSQKWNRWRWASFSEFVVLGAFWSGKIVLRGQNNKSRAILYNLGQEKFEFHFFCSKQIIELKMQIFLGLYNLAEMFLLKQILCRKSSPE